MHSSSKRPIFILLCLYRTAAAAADGARYIKEININDFPPFFFYIKRGHLLYILMSTWWRRSGCDAVRYSLPPRYSRQLKNIRGTFFGKGKKKLRNSPKWTKRKGSAGIFSFLEIFFFPRVAAQQLGSGWVAVAVAHSSRAPLQWHFFVVWCR